MKANQFIKKLVFVAGISVIVVGTISYLYQKNSGNILGATTSTKDYIEKNFPAAGELINKLPFTSRVLGNKNQTNNTPDSNSEEFVNESLSAAGQQLEILASNGNKIKDQLTEFVAQIKESTQSTPLHEKAIEYGQYVYCQQVVKEYETTPQ